MNDEEYRNTVFVVFIAVLLVTSIFSVSLIASA